MKRVSYLEPEGTFSEIAVDGYFKKDAEKIACISISEAISLVLKGTTEFCVVPIENKILGKIKETAIALDKVGLKLETIDTIKIPIEMAIGGFGNEDKIAKILSKDKALQQCTQYIKRKFGVASLEEAYKADRIVNTTSTTKAMEIVVSNKDDTQAAIGSILGLKKYGIPVYQKNISDVKENYTIFAIVTRAY